MVGHSCLRLGGLPGLVQLGDRKSGDVLIREGRTFRKSGGKGEVWSLIRGSEVVGRSCLRLGGLPATTTSPPWSEVKSRSMGVAAGLPADAQFFRVVVGWSLSTSI